MKDRVLMEFDIHVCNRTLGEQTQLCLFQYPVRPPWRPYDRNASDETIRIKPKSQRLEVSVPLDTHCANYHYGYDEQLKIDRMTLRSTTCELASTAALATVRKGKVYLLPIDAVHRLRPTLTHIDMPTTSPSTSKVEATKVKLESDPDSDMTVLQARVAKKETERQQEQRMKSYQYLSEAEAKEPWTNLKMAHGGVEQQFFDHMIAPSEEQLQTSLGRKSYLTNLFPSPAEQATPLLDAGSGAAAAAKGGSRPKHPSSSKSTAPSSRGANLSDKPASESEAELIPEAPLSEEEAKAFKKSMTQLLRSYPVVKLRGIRWWLANSKSAAKLTRLSTASDTLLKHATLQTGICAQSSEVFVQTVTDNSDIDSLRGVILGLLSRKPALKKQEIISKAKESGSQMTDAQYVKAVKEICQSKASVWVLKPGFAGDVQGKK